MALTTREPQNAKTLTKKCDANLEAAAETRGLFLVSYECAGGDHCKIRCGMSYMSPEFPK